MPLCNVVDSVVLPDCLRAVRAYNRDVRAWGVFCRLLRCAVPKRVMKPTVCFDLPFGAGDHKGCTAQVATAEPARIITDLAYRLALIVCHRRG